MVTVWASRLEQAGLRSTGYAPHIGLSAFNTGGGLEYTKNLKRNRQ
jgi:hypothetical protein